MTRNKNRKKYKLDKNCFYIRIDDKGGHPAMIYGYDESGNEVLYKAVTFTSHKTHNSYPLKKSINKRTRPQSFIKKQPIVKPYKKFIDQKLKGFKVKAVDRSTLNKVKKKK